MHGGTAMGTPDLVDFDQKVSNSCWGFKALSEVPRLAGEMENEPRVFGPRKRTPPVGWFMDGPISISHSLPSRFKRH